MTLSTTFCSPDDDDDDDDGIPNDGIVVVGKLGIVGIVGGLIGKS